MTPSFWGIQTWENCTSNGTQGTKAQFMWLCNDNIDHTWQIWKTITHLPQRVPKTWLVEMGTNLMDNEIKALDDRGYKLAKKRATTTKNMQYHLGALEATMKRIELAISMEAIIEGFEIMKQ